jgi:hypothetical protein
VDELLTGTEEAASTGEGGSGVVGGWKTGGCGGEEATAEVTGTGAATEEVWGLGRWEALVEVLSVVAATGMTVELVSATVGLTEELCAAVFVGLVLEPGAPAWYTFKELIFQNESAKADGLFWT